MTELIRQTLTHLLLPLLAIGGVLVAAVVTTLPVWAAFECGRRARRRSATERTRAQIAHITERARVRDTEQALADLDDNRWLEIGEGGDETDPASLAVPDGCAPLLSRSAGGCREEERAPLRAPSITVASPDELLAALFQGFRADVPDPMRAQPDVVVAATRELVGEILDGCSFRATHPGRRNAELAVLTAMAFSAAPTRITRN